MVEIFYCIREKTLQTPLESPSDKPPRAMIRYAQRRAEILITNPNPWRESHTMPTCCVFLFRNVKSSICPCEPLILNTGMPLNIAQGHLSVNCEALVKNKNGNSNLEINKMRFVMPWLFSFAWGWPIWGPRNACEWPHLSSYSKAIKCYNSDVSFCCWGRKRQRTDFLKMYLYFVNMYKNGGEEVKWFILNDVWIHFLLPCSYRTPVRIEGRRVHDWRGEFQSQSTAADFKKICMEFY